jgi:hypothetical protein
MSQSTKVIVLASAAVLVFDTLASMASMMLGFSYALASVGTFLIYSATGFYATKYANLKMGLLSSAIIGLIDVTLGWAISWTIGPGKPVLQTIDLGGIVLIIASVTLMATMSGLFGGLVSKVLPSIRRSST